MTLLPPEKVLAPFVPQGVMGATVLTAAKPRPSVRARRPRLRTSVVWGAWALLSAGLVGYVWLVNDDFPVADDWHLVPAYTGHETVTLSWLWAPHNEHRLPLPKLLLVLGGAATHHDYRTGVLLSALGLSALAAALIVTAGRLRGGPSFADAFIPLALLHWGQSETLLISYALNLAASTVLAGLALLIIVRVRGVPTARQGLFFGLVLLALPLCGFNGVVLVPPLAVWLLVAAVARWRSGGAAGRRDGAVWSALALAALALVAVCVLTMQRTPESSQRPTVAVVARTAAQVFAESLGPFAEASWPFSGVAVAALAALTLYRLRQEWRGDPAERLRVLGLLAFGAALVALALAVGWGRGLIGDRAGFMTRYATLAAPALCLAYLVCRTAPRRAVTAVLTVAMVGVFLYNTGRGVERAAARREKMQRIQADVAAGLTSAELAKKWGDIYNTKAEALLTDFFEMLRQARQGPYRKK
jgi:hypothetical protein